MRSAIGWLTNSADSGSIACGAADSALSGTIGSLHGPMGIAVDNNVWTSNSADDSVTKFVGLTSPVVVPLAAAGR